MKKGMMAKLAVGAAAFALVLTGCSGSGGDDGGGAKHPLTIGMPNGPQTDNNNPFIATSAAASLGYTWLMYEPLAQWNPTDPATEPEPWLAESWEWNDDYTSVSITPRDDVTWSDGEKMTVDDVAFTFNLIKDTEGFNANAISYKDVTVDGDAVTLTFESSQLLNKTKVLGTFIVPEHVWSKMDDPTKDTNQDPVGTGPYTLKSWTQQVITFEPNEDYWGGTPPVPEIQYTSYTDNNAQLTALLSGSAQWSYVFIPDMEKTYLSKSETNNAYMPTGLGIDALFLNTQEAPFNNVAMRQATNMVIDREAVHTQGYSGFKGLVDTVTGLPSPAGDAFTAEQYKGKTVEVDVEGAKAVLEEAGYTWNSDDKLIDPDGNQVTVEFIDPAGWSDYLASLQIMADNLSEIGVDATVETPTVDAWTSALAEGDFQASLHWTNTGATPWDIYSNIMDGAQLKPIGEAASWNFGRFENDEVTKLLADYAVTPDEAARQKMMDRIQEIFVEEVPAIPMAAGPIGAQYSTKYWTGFPSEDDPYAVPQPTQPSISKIVMNLTPAK
ncbi:ABC transporter substrate-binding protein [Paramicrobacterium agarici]|uniref:Peptide/nickel transport system substrate-binding protein n=1 Tax=Paramicrobacterium agarici TaxID=630514 RepID=A0A2A9DVX0_9MICO|nr:ABC transporter substrate-binding protein [Microbacterium agarici]PFG30090.1 peptide/nickel transport system substrate-binding protein [Microbacterium agarici]